MKQQMKSRSCQTLLRTYSDIIIQDNVPIFEEVVDVEDVKHSSSMSMNNLQNYTKSSKDDKRMRKQLKNELTQYRIDQAAAIDKPAWNIFTNAALQGICASLPTNEDDLLRVKGIGPKKLEMYGDDILDIVKKYAGDGGLMKEEVAAAAPTGKSKMSRPEPIKIESLTQEQRKAAEMALDGKSGKNHSLEYVV
jgi:superfamily II DNA helicase RecQ